MVAGMINGRSSGGATAAATPALALLRAVRAAAESGVLPDAETLHAAGTALDPNEDFSDGVALAELLRIVTAPHAARGVDLLYDSGMARWLLPELVTMREMPSGRHKDIYRHTLLVLQRTEPDPVLRLAALLHDIAKPQTLTIVDGAVHFPGHAEIGAAITRRRLRRLGADPELNDAVTTLVGLHLRANSYEDDWTDSAVRRLDHDAGEQIGRLLALSRADVTSGRREVVERALRRVDRLEQRLAEVRAADVRPVCPLDGHALMAMFDRRPGPWIGRIKSHLEALVAAGELAPDDVERATEIAHELMRDEG